MQRILIMGVNWIGDSIMTMPALQVLRREHPDAHLALMVKPHLAPLWRMHAAPDEVLTLPPGWSGIRQATRLIRGKQFDTAFVLPHSFRSALPPFLGRVPRRVGMPGHGRDWMLTNVVPVEEQTRDLHQACEYLALMTHTRKLTPIEPPLLTIPDEMSRRAADRLESLSHPIVGIMPGAARGPSKQWPAEHFIAAGRQLMDDLGAGIALFGAAGEVDLCARIRDALGPGAITLAGSTPLPEWAALLHACDIVLANDSGGMHLAAAVERPVVAIYGMTDPAKTGPLGMRCRILQSPGPCARSIPRDSAEARERLASIRPEQVCSAIKDLLASSDATRGGDPYA